MPEWLLQVVTMLLGAVGLYAGIRYDLGRLTAKIEAHHERLDRLEDKVFK